MKRALIAAAVAVSFFATNLLAAETAAPLAPGKPAGVQKAQDDIDWTTTAWIGLGIGAAVLLGLSTRQENHNTVPTVPVSTAT